MTAPSDFMPAVRFELSEVKWFDGRVSRYTKTWDDLDQELKQEKDFGLAVKKAVNRLSAPLATLIGDHSRTELEKAQRLYRHFQQRFQWNGKFGPFASEGLDKAYREGSGSVGDINLGLVAALQAAGFEAHPFLISTRNNGYPADIHPVISDFNYVVAHLRLKDRIVLLDATERLLPFGMLPHRCLSNKGRVMDFEKSYWMEIPATGLFREITQLKLTLDSASRLFGSYSAYKYDYAALKFRHEILETGDTAKYIREKEDALDAMRIVNYRLRNLDSLDQPMIESYELSFDPQGEGRGVIYIPVLPLENMEENPFKLRERYYPVNFGTGWEIQNLVEINLPENYRAATLPEAVGISLPANGGSFILNVTQHGNRINVLSKIVLSKPVYSQAEYYYVKELFSRIVQAQAGNIVVEAME